MEFNMSLALDIILAVVIGFIVLYVTTLHVKSRTDFISSSIKMIPFEEHSTLDITRVGDNELVHDYRTGKEIVYIV